MLELPCERNLVVVVFKDIEHYAMAPASAQQVVDEIMWKYD